MVTCISRVDGLSTDPQVWGVTMPVVRPVGRFSRKVVCAVACAMCLVAHAVASVARATRC